MISSFTSTDISDPLTRWLMLNDKDRNSAATPTDDQLFDAMRRKHTSTTGSFQISHTQERILSTAEMKCCIKFLDAAVQFYALEGKDTKIILGDDQGWGGAAALSALFGIDNSIDSNSDGALTKYQKLLNTHSHSSDAKIALRRTEGSVELGCIDFHCDGGYATNTIQIALNDDTEYDGGKLCFVTPRPRPRATATGSPRLKLELTVPKRYAGTMTGHKRDVLHAVTKLHRGVRYSLFVVDRRNGLGENDVKCVDANIVCGILKR